MNHATLLFIASDRKPKMLKMSTSLLFCALILSCGCAYGQDTDYSDNDAQILILGAGIAGLHAADLLHANNITDFIILEGDSVPQGVLKTHVIDGHVFETGRPWAHVPAKPALDAIGVAYHESDYESIIVLNDEGQDVTGEFDEAYSEYEATIDKKAQIAEDSIAERAERLDVDQRTSLAMSGWVSKIIEILAISQVIAQQVEDLGYIMAWSRHAIHPPPRPSPRPTAIKSSA